MSSGTLDMAAEVFTGTDADCGVKIGNDCIYLIGSGLSFNDISQNLTDGLYPA